MKLETTAVDLRNEGGQGLNLPLGRILVLVMKKVVKV